MIDTFSGRSNFLITHADLLQISRDSALSYNVLLKYLRFITNDTPDKIILPPELFIFKCSWMPENLFLDYLMPPLPANWSKMVLLLDIAPDAPEYAQCAVAQRECKPGEFRHSIAVFVERGKLDFYFYESNNAATEG